MAPPTHIKTAVILLIFHITSSHSAKNTAKHTAAAVHEIVNEQARIDDKKVFTSPGIPSSGTLPYGNPLAGNSHHNAQLHAQNQQAMFNAEKIRQHRAQLQRWNKSPTHTDSYMRAYHESQESHQLALEQQQANLKETKPTTSTVRTPSRRRQNLRQDLKRTKGPDPIKIMAEDAVLSENNRNHRSYGSDEYQQYLQPNKYKTVFITPGPTYDQGVTIKPNGNVGLPQYKYAEELNQLYTQAIPTQYVYPKQYRQMQHYESAKDIETLNALLSKEPQDQLTELNSLIHFDKQNSKELETPIDLYFYLKNPSLAQHYEKSLYAEGQNYGGGYAPEVKDHTPITEEVDDIEDPNKHAKRPFIPQPSKPEDITTNNINYVHIEPTVVTKPEYHLNEIDKPSYQALKYEKPLTFYSQEANEKDSSERYLHHNGQHTGVQLLNHDGTGVSAFGDDNVSILVKNRGRRSAATAEQKLDTSPFLVSDDNETTIDFSENIPQPEELKVHWLSSKNDYKAFLAKPNFALDNTDDNFYDEYEDLPQMDQNNDNDDFKLEYDELEDYSKLNHKHSNIQTPSRTDYHNSDLKGSSSEKFGLRLNSKPNFHSSISPSQFATSYGVPESYYNLSENYGVPYKNHEISPTISSFVGSLEPVYMLTESQLKSLVGHHNLNIGHLDVFQWQTKMKSKRPHRVRKYKGKNRRRIPNQVKKNLLKLHKLNIL